jgi:hypothetical protein
MFALIYGKNKMIENTFFISHYLTVIKLKSLMNQILSEKR